MPLQQSICVRCLIHLQYSRALHSSAVVARVGGPKTRLAGGLKSRLLSPTHPFPEPRRDGGYNKPTSSGFRHKPIEKFDRRKTRIVSVPQSVEGKKNAFLFHLRNWQHNLRASTFFQTLGFNREDLPRLIRRFTEIVKKEFEEDDSAQWDWGAIDEKMHESMEGTLNKTLMKRFLAVMPNADRSCGRLEPIREALNLSHPAEWHPIARQVHRKIIMHVGPTNSGKTYHALRALAASEAGLYAGPLRLLATEIFGRLNKGDIAPVGADTTIPHPRVCNLITGEEQKILDPDAPLISATVEMVPLTKKFEVVVIDEIQMIANPDRGNAWTQALLGLNANEIHLCGEESAVPLVKKILHGSGDELIINRYERLTPLELAPKSLEGNLKRVQPGDCVVAFSKNNIFAIKTLIEEQTGLRCAVVYGRLPPEVRAEQAEKFNKGLDNHSVLVASDAVGMGLNLKIKRVIFSTVAKWNGYERVLLKLSDIKQIAGRAGRFGMHGDDAIGLATTLLREEHNILKIAMETNVADLTQAVLAPTNELLSRLHQTLPPNTGLGQIYQLLMDTAICPTPFCLTEYVKLIEAAAVIDEACPTMGIATRAVLTQTPLQWQDPEAVRILQKMLHEFAAGKRVDVVVCLEEVGLMTILEDVNDAREEQKTLQDKKEDPTRAKEYPPSKSVLSTKEASTRLEALELMHKMTCAYLWLSYRFPVTFDMRTTAQNLKLEAELGIELCLEMLQSEKAKSLARRLQEKAAQTQELEALVLPVPSSTFTSQSVPL